MINEIEKNYKPIAVRDDHAGKTVVSYNSDENKFLLAVSGKLAGPFTLDELKALQSNINDVIDMKGRHYFIKDYDVRGNKNG